MSNDPGVLVAGQARVWLQENGINPGAAYIYYGCTSLDGPSQDLGTPDPVYCPSPTLRNQWDIIDDAPKTPALGTTDFTSHAAKLLTDAWMDLKDRRCKFNMQVAVGACQRPDQFDKWDAKVLFLGCRLNNLKLSTLNPLSGGDNAPVDFSGTISFQDWKIIHALKFTEKADSTILAEVLDGFFYDTAQCGDCGTPSDGCQAIYLLTLANAGSPGLSSQVVYSLNGGATWASIDIPTLAGLSGIAAAPMGDKMVVISQAGGNHHYSLFSSINAGSTSWTAVTGYVSTKGPRAIWVKSSTDAFIAAAGGYIYHLASATSTPTVLTDGSVTTQQLNAIHGSGLTVVAVGNSNAVLYSANGGDTFSLVTGPTVGVNLTAVWVMGPNAWLVGTGNGKLYYTLDAGATWTQIGGLGSGVTVINDIAFENDVVGYMAAEVNGAAVVYRTTDSGNSWQSTSPSITGLPTAVRCNFVATCGVNKVLTGGRKTAGGDGLAALAE